MALLATVNICMLIIYALILNNAPPSWISVANQAGPATLLGTCLWSLRQSISKSALALWTPVPWFQVACGAYFGLGPLVYHFGAVESIIYVDSFYPVDEIALLRTNLLDAAGIAVVAVAFLIVNHTFAYQEQVNERPFNYIVVQWLTFAFLVTGLFVSLVFVIPYKLGLLSWTLPGTVQYLSTFSNIAIILAFILINRGFAYYRWLLYPLITVEMFMAMMTFTKQAVIEVLIAIGLGLYFSRLNLRALFFGGIGVVMLYVLVLTPFVSFGRIAFKTVGVGTVDEIVTAVKAYAEIREDFVGYDPGVQKWWTRLSYSNAQAFSIESYEHGSRGETVELALYAFVPRALFPSKPLMTPGQEFTIAVMGDDQGETSTAPGVFGEAYWNGGWILVVILCLYIGVLLAGFTIFAERTMSAGKYEYLPIVMTGLSMGYQPNDWFAVVYVGSLINALGLYVILRFIVMPFIRGLQASLSLRIQPITQ